MGYSFPIWSYLKKLTICDIITLIKGRWFSAETMVLNVFMKRIRSLQFGYTMSSRAENTKNNLFNGKTVFVNIYDFISSNDRKATKKISNLLVPTTGMVNIAVEAENIGTKLWLSKEEVKILVSCGRVTMCQTLLKFIWRNEKGIKPNDPASPYYGLYTKWVKLQKEFP